jgi:hypothetical protein
MKVSFGIGLGVGLSVFAALPATGNAQCFAAPRRYVSQAYYPPVQYAQPSQVVYPAQPMPQVTQGQYVQGQPYQPQVSQSQYRPSYQPPYQPIQPTGGYGQPMTDGSSGDVRLTLHRLLEDQFLNCRLYVVSALADLPDKDALSQRLTKNATDIVAAVKPVLGDANADKLGNLLKERVQIGTDFIAAVKANDATKKADQAKRLQTNADEIGTFLSQTNPRAWPEQVVKGMLKENTDLMTQAIEARARQDWSAEATAFEKVHNQARHLADMLAAGAGAPGQPTSGVPGQYPGQVSGQYPGQIEYQTPTYQTPTRGRIIRR